MKKFIAVHMPNNVTAFDEPITNKQTNNNFP